ncbi:condensation domain-containing protein [Rhizomonospora bruguierae]|uniref:condensation domain-containing protein n=1 Tax=Rhizomonospora bruguierae TaxID=1581705 RepID=UPI001BCB1501|nr:condensation domain-containing protein [Micromonospora sp. NBRC 107566]
MADPSPVGAVAAPPVIAVTATATYPMTVEQESIWLDDALHDGPSRYLESWVYRLTGQVDRRGVDWAYRELVRRHEGLRTRYVLAGEDLVQQVLPADGMPGLARRPCPAAELDAELRSLVRRPLDLAVAPIRGTLLDVAGQDVVLVVQVHHIVADDWALHVLEQEFGECYRAWLAGRPAALAAAPQPGRYARAQRQAGPDPAAPAYWRRQLAGLPADAARSLPPDRPEQPVPGGAQLRFQLEPAAGRRIRAACKALRVTPFTLIAAATGALLADGTGSPEVLVGTPVSRRGSAELDRMVAYLGQVLPLRLRVDPGQPFAELAHQVKRVAAEAMTHRDIPTAELARQLRRPGAGAPALARTVLVLDDDNAGLDLPGITAERLHVPSGVAKYDLLLTLVAGRTGYQGFLDYASDRYTHHAARQLTDRLAALLDAATREPHRPWSLADVLRAARRT